MAVEYPRFSLAELGAEIDFGAGAGGLPENELPADEIVVAQADPAPANTPQNPDPGAPVSETLAPGADNAVHLPAGASIDQLRVQGTDLIPVQPDGSEIRIVNAALNIPTFVIDDIVISREALVAALEDSGVNFAAGPDGTLSVTGASPQSSGGSFQDASFEFERVDSNFLSLLTDDGESESEGGEGDRREEGAGPSIAHRSFPA